MSSQSGCVCGSNSTNIAKALASTTGWNTTWYDCAVGNNQSANNATGFSAVPAGYCVGSLFSNASSSAYFWSSSQYESGMYDAYHRFLDYYGAYVVRSDSYKNRGFSVRCVKN